MVLYCLLIFFSFECLAQSKQETIDYIKSKLVSGQSFSGNECKFNYHTTRGVIQSNYAHRIRANGRKGFASERVNESGDFGVITWIGPADIGAYNGMFDKNVLKIQGANSSYRLYLKTHSPRDAERVTKSLWHLNKLCEKKELFD